MCVASCDPVSATGCGAGERCGMVDANADVAVATCGPGGVTDATAGEECEEDGDGLPACATDDNECR